MRCYMYREERGICSVFLAYKNIVMDVGLSGPHRKADTLSWFLSTSISY